MRITLYHPGVEVNIQQIQSTCITSSSFVNRFVKLKKTEVTSEMNTWIVISLYEEYTSIGFVCGGSLTSGQLFLGFFQTGINWK